MPAEVIEAVAYLESWGDAKAESPAGPKGIMQISEATARTMGLTGGAWHALQDHPRKSTGQEQEQKAEVPDGLSQDTIPGDPARRPPDSRPRHTGGGEVPGGHGAKVRRARLGHFRLPLRPGLRGRDARSDAARARHPARTRRRWRGCSSPAARPGTGSSIRPSSSRCSATTRPPTGSASSGRSSCWLCTAAIRPHLSCWRSSTRASSRGPMGVPTARRTGFRSGSSRTTWCSIAATTFTATWGTGWSRHSTGRTTSAIRSGSRRTIRRFSKTSRRPRRRPSAP